ncbi:hypothetical protein B566_EDAN011060, partial [Ephemera danica]
MKKSVAEDEFQFLVVTEIHEQILVENDTSRRGKMKKSVAEDEFQFHVVTEIHGREMFELTKRVFFYGRGVTSLTCGRNYTQRLETLTYCEYSIVNKSSDPLCICDTYNQTLGILNNCFISTRPSAVTIIDCYRFSVGGVTDTDDESIVNLTPLLITRIQFSVNGRAEEKYNGNIWCLSISKVQIQISNSLEQIFEWLDMDIHFSKLLLVTDDLEVNLNFPYTVPENDAFVELPPSCNLDARYDKYDNFTEISNEFLVRRQGVIDYLRFYASDEVDVTKMMIDLSKYDVRNLDLNGEVMNIRVPIKSNFPKLTNLHLVDCHISKIHPDNFNNFINVEEMDLSYNRLKNVPTGLEKLSKLKYLDLSYQHSSEFDINFSNIMNIEMLVLNGLPITKLINTSFSCVPKIISLHLRSCQIVAIEENTFHDLKYLSFLDISDNTKLKQIFSDTFLHLASPASLLIANNPQMNNSLGSLNFKNISFLDMSNCSFTSFPGTISIIDSVFILDLSSNAINLLENENFNPKIRSLNISYNRFETVNYEMADILSKLSFADIGGNPFDCQNCAQNDFRYFLKKHGDIVLNLSKNKTLKCVSPVEDEGKAIISVIYDCYTFWLTIGTPVASAVIFLAILLSAFVYAYRFELIYLKQLWRMKQRNEDRLVQRNVPFEFDAFISYCAANRSWVMDKLLSSLEPPLGQYRLCFHERDFNIGRYIMDNVGVNIEKSRRVIFVLSNNFLESEELKQNLVPLSLRVLLATRTYLEWNQNRPEVFWLRLRQALGKPIACPILESQETLEPFRDVDEFLNELRA